MPKRWLAVLGILVIILAALRPSMPSHEGKPLSFWLEQLPATIVGPGSVEATSKSEVISYDFTEGVGYLVDTQSDTNKAQAAITAMGRRCLPTLLKRLRTKDTAWTRLREKVSGWAVQWRVSKGRWVFNAQSRRGQAITAVRHLGSDARPILAAVLKLTEDEDKGVRAAALEVVRRLSPSDYTRIRAEQSSTKRD